MTKTSNGYPLRISRSTTGVVHAAAEIQREIFDYSKPADSRGTGTFRTVTVKACGAEPNTGRRVSGTNDTAATITCKKCLKKVNE